MDRRGLVAAMGLLTALSTVPAAYGAPARIAQRVVALGAQSIRVVTVTADLADAETILTMRFANGIHPACRRCEAFDSMTVRTKAAAVANGTYFGVRTFETLGNLVVAGQVVQRKANFKCGSALTIGLDGKARIDTLKVDGPPDLQKAWLSVTSGPRLLRHGKVWLHSRLEGFQDPHLYGRHARTAVGLSKDGSQLVMACFPEAISLGQEAAAMERLGLYDAINLDGGPSVGLAYRGKVLAKPRWGLTNALVLYDASHPAPEALRRSLVWDPLSVRGRGLKGDPPIDAAVDGKARG